MIFDTDVLIWFLRGNARAADRIDQSLSRDLSIVSYMELVQGVRSRLQIRRIKGFLADFEFGVFP